MSRDDKEIQITPAALRAMKDGEVANFIAAVTPGGIEAQEAAGQRDLVNNFKLPIDCNLDDEDLDKLGFELGEPVAPSFNGKPLFRACQLPPGWKIEATDHAMGSRLFDDVGADRASVFFKAAFYDSRASIHFLARYHVHYDHELVDAGDLYMGVHDRKIEKFLFETAHHRFDPETRIILSGEYEGRETHQVRSKLFAEACAWRDEHYPAARDPRRYWND